MATPQRLGKEEQQALQRALGDVIREHRRPIASQDKFADTVGIYRSHMGMLEQGKLDLRLSTLVAVAAALDMPASELLRAAEERLS